MMYMVYRLSICIYVCCQFKITSVRPIKTGKLSINMYIYIHIYQYKNVYKSVYYRKIDVYMYTYIYV